MIYSNFGCELDITAYCGKHKVKGLPHPVMLVRATRKDDGAERHYFADTLRADGGINAIDAAIDAAPEVALAGAELKRAIEQAM